MQPPTGRMIYCPVVEAEVAGTAGAGDAFGSTFAAYTVLGAEPDFALRAAANNAASVLGFIDTSSGLLARSELDRTPRGRAVATKCDRVAVMTRLAAATPSVMFDREEHRTDSNELFRRPNGDVAQESRERNGC